MSHDALTALAAILAHLQVARASEHAPTPALVLNISYNTYNGVGVVGATSDSTVQNSVLTPAAAPSEVSPEIIASLREGLNNFLSTIKHIDPATIDSAQRLFASNRVRWTHSFAADLLHILKQQATYKDVGVVGNVTGPAHIQNIRANTVSIDDLRSFVRDTRVHLNELPEEARASVSAALDQVESEALAPTPRLRIIDEILKSLRAVLENAGGELAAATVRAMASGWL